MQIVAWKPPLFPLSLCTSTSRPLLSCGRHPRPEGSVGHCSQRRRRGAEGPGAVSHLGPAAEYFCSSLWLQTGGGNGSPLQHSGLENPMDRGARWATVRGVTKSQTWLSEEGCPQADPTPWSLFSHTHFHSHPFQLWPLLTISLGNVCSAGPCSSRWFHLWLHILPEQPRGKTFQWEPWVGSHWTSLCHHAQPLLGSGDQNMLSGQFWTLRLP